MLSVLAAGVAAVVETGRSLVLYVDPDSGSAGRIMWRAPRTVCEPLSSMPRSMMAASLNCGSTNNGDDMSQIHAIVWLDHLNTTVIGLSLGKSELVAYHADVLGRTASTSFGYD